MLIQNAANPPLNALKMAIGCMMVSVGLYALQDVFIKLLPGELHLMQVVFFRSLFAFLPIFFFSKITGDTPIGVRLVDSATRIEKTDVTLNSFQGLNRSQNKFGMTKGSKIHKLKHDRDSTKFFSTDKSIIHLIRSLFAVLALLCFIASFRLMPLAEAYSLTYTTPLFIVVLAPFLLKEKVKLHQWMVIGIGFLGVLVITRPTLQNTLNRGAFIALTGSFFYALSLILVRKQSVQDTTTFIVVTILAASILATGIALPFVWTPFDLKTLGMFVILGILGGSAQYIMVHAYRLVPIATIAPFDYVSIIWASIFGYIFFDEILDHPSILGACLIIGSGFYLIRRKQRL